MNNQKLLRLLTFSLIPMGLGSALMQKEGLLSSLGIALMIVTSVGILALIAYMYRREKHGSGKSAEALNEASQTKESEAVADSGDRSAGNVSPIFAAIVLGIIAIVVIRAFVKGM